MSAKIMNPSRSKLRGTEPSKFKKLVKAALLSAVLCGSNAFAKPQPQELWLPPFAPKIMCASNGPFVRFENGEILAFMPRDVLVSGDEGKSWESYVIFSKDDPYMVESGVMIQTQSGAIVLAFSSRHFQSPGFKWNTATRDTDGKAMRPGSAFPTWRRETE